MDRLRTSSSLAKFATEFRHHRFWSKDGAAVQFVPLQSGDNDRLRAMKLLNTRESFLAIVQVLREEIPGIGITTDLIVGFPGETEGQFQRTLQVVEGVRFDGA